MKTAAILLSLLAAPASAATITEVSGPGAGRPVALSPADFTRAPRAACGFGESVVNDGCSVALKDGSSPNPFGRYNPLIAGEPWIDSQDIGNLVWDLSGGSFVFGLVDAFDQLPKPALNLGPSFFRILSETGETLWSIADREPNATLHWLLVEGADALRIRTQTNDGYGIVMARTQAPVPLPASGLLFFVALAVWTPVVAIKRAIRRMF